MFRKLFGGKPRRPSPEELLQTLLAFIRAETWTESQRIVEQHPELLTDAADALLEQLAAAQEDENARRAVEQHRALLRRCRADGIEAAFAEIASPSASDENIPEALRPLLEAISALPEDQRNAVLELFTSVNSPEELMAALEENPALAAILERAFTEIASPSAGSREGRVGIPPQFAADVQRAMQGVQRYQRTGDLKALDAAIAAWERVLNRPDFSAAEERFRLAAWNDAGGAYLRRYWRTGETRDLDAALQLWQQAVDATPAGHPDLPGYLNNLGNGLRARYSRTGRMEDLEEALRVYRQAVDATPAGHPDLPSILNNLGTGLSARYSRTGRMEDLEKGRNAYAQAVASPEINPAESVRAARNWLRWAFERRAWDEVMTAWEALQAAQQVRLRSQFERADKSFSLRETQGLPARAAYALWQLGQPQQAVETLEAGRAQLLREALERQRSDLHALAGGAHEALYRAYTQAAQSVETLHAQPYDRRPPDWGLQMRAAQADLDAAIAALRELPGFAYFLQSLPFAEIQAQAADAPLVYLAATERGGMAFLVGRFMNRPSGVLPLDLPALTEEALREQIQSYAAAYFPWRANPSDQAARAAWFAALEGTLRWLGETVMGPLLAALREAGLPASATVRLIPGGLLGLLPLHAALTPSPLPGSGRGEGAGGRGEGYALDYYTFTYAPSAQALYHAREAAARPADSLLAVDNPDGSLRFSADEIESALHAFPQHTHLPGAQADRRAVIEAVQRHGVLHFSTHGVAGWTEAEDSRLQLADGDLTLREIFALRLERPRLAVLSACETGVPGTDLPDEVESLPSGLMQAGVPGVVGTLWSVNDLSTAMLMTRFYDLWREAGVPAPEALRQAQIWLRDLSQDAAALDELEALATRAGLRMTSQQADKFLSLTLVRKFSHPFYWAAFTYTGL